MCCVKRPMPCALPQQRQHQISSCRGPDCTGAWHVFQHKCHFHLETSSLIWNKSNLVLKLPGKQSFEKENKHRKSFASIYLLVPRSAGGRWVASICPQLCYGKRGRAQNIPGTGNGSAKHPERCEPPELVLAAGKSRTLNFLGVIGPCGLVAMCRSWQLFCLPFAERLGWPSSMPYSREGEVYFFLFCCVQ